jgi:hypothetical protein
MRALIIALMFAVVAPPRPARANDNTPLTFSATLGAITLQGRPGDVFTRQFQLTLDRTQARAHFAARFEDWWRTEDGRQSVYASAGTLRRSCATWTTVNPVESAVDPCATLVVRFTVAVPREVAPGGYWCALTVDQLPDPVSAAGVGVRFVASVSTGVFLYIGPVEREAGITALDVDADRVRLRVRNLGNAPLGIDGRVEFLHADTLAPVASVQLTRGTLLTEPVVFTTFDVALPAVDALPSGRYLVRAILDIGADHDIGGEREVVIARSPDPRR